MANERPTSTEMEVLAILWDLGSATVRDVHEVLGADRDIGYTGVLKLLQIMTAKGLVIANKDERRHVYRASEAPEATRRRAVGDFIRKLFPDCPGQLALHALQEQVPSVEDVAEIRRLLDAYEKKAKD
jgi:BlaI family penicillinase repressor